MSSTDFAQLPLHSDLLQNLESMGYEHMTSIQATSLPPILEGRDVIAKGKTGSGKTAAFALGTLHKLDIKCFKVQALILCPTRELSEQVAGEVRKLARRIQNIKVLTLCGGSPVEPQINSLSHGVHIVVGTPGRVEDHLQRQTLDLEAVETLVLDEADRMLDMGFQEAIEDIVARVPSERQTLLFSATFSAPIRALAEGMMRQAISVDSQESHDQTSIEQCFYPMTTQETRPGAVMRLLLQYQPQAAMVFCNTKRDTQEIADLLSQRGFGAIAIHGDLQQRERDQAIMRFTNQSANVLVATDVAARGLDVPSVDMVINCHIANNVDNHTHRIGRTGRAGASGRACTLYEDHEIPKLLRLHSHIDPLAESQPLPDDKVFEKSAPETKMQTLQIDGGKKNKLRPGDILGALTKDAGIAGDLIGKIKVADKWSFVAVAANEAKTALKHLAKGKIKGRTYRARLLK